MPGVFVPIPEVAKFELVLSYDSQVCENVFHVSTPGGWTVAKIQATCAQISEWWRTDLRSKVPTSMYLIRVMGTDQSAQDGPRAEYVYEGDTAGTHTTGVALPNHVTVAISWTTAQRGRSYRGRSYHIGLSSDQIVGNRVETSHLSTLRTAYARLITVTAGSGSDHLVIASRKHLGAPRVTGIATNITTASADPVIDSQRRRLPGRGK